MNNYAIRGFMDWLSNMALIQYSSSNRSFFIVFAQYFLHLTIFDIRAVPKPPARASGIHGDSKKPKPRASSSQFGLNGPSIKNQGI